MFFASLYRVGLVVCELAEEHPLCLGRKRHPVLVLKSFSGHVALKWFCFFGVGVCRVCSEVVPKNGDACRKGSSCFPSVGAVLCLGSGVGRCLVDRMSSERLLFACLLMLNLAERDCKTANLGFSQSHVAAPCFAMLSFPGHRLLDRLGREGDCFAHLSLCGAWDQKTCSRVGRWVSTRAIAGGKGLGVGREEGSSGKMGLVEVKKTRTCCIL